MVPISVSSEAGSMYCTGTVSAGWRVGDEVGLPSCLPLQSPVAHSEGHHAGTQQAQYDEYGDVEDIAPIPCVTMTTI